jgi:hypothetical protein
LIGSEADAAAAARHDQWIVERIHDKGAAPSPAGK